MKILGIDPGTATTGYGVIEVPSRPSLSRPGGKKSEKSSRGIKLLEYGCITTPQSATLAKRLAEIYRDLNKLIKKHRPQILAVETLYFYKNAKTAMAVAQARGVVLLCARQHKIKIREFTPLQVKLNLTSYGKADKKQVQYMVKKLLNLKTAPKPDDAADALAVAICATNR